jgi:hypothetical protein
MRTIDNGFRCQGSRNGNTEISSAYCRSGLCDQYKCVQRCARPLTQNPRTGCQQSF